MTDEEAQELAAAKRDRDLLLSVMSDMRDEIGDLQKQLEGSRKADMFDATLQMLRANAHDPGAAKNYVEMNFSWDEALAPELPFRHVSVVFRRPGAKSPAALVREAIAAKNRAVQIAHCFDDDPSREELRELRQELKVLSDIPDCNILTEIP